MKNVRLNNVMSRNGLSQDLYPIDLKNIRGYIPHLDHPDTSNMEVYDKYYGKMLNLAEAIIESTLPDHWVHHKSLKVDLWFAMRLEKLARQAIEKEGKEWPERGCWDECDVWGFSARTVSKIAYMAGCRIGSRKFNLIAGWFVRVWAKAGRTDRQPVDALNYHHFIKNCARKIKSLSVEKTKFLLKGMERAYWGPHAYNVNNLITLGRVSKKTAIILSAPKTEAHMKEMGLTKKNKNSWLNYAFYRECRNLSEADIVNKLSARLAWAFMGKRMKDPEAKIHPSWIGYNGINNYGYLYRHSDESPSEFIPKNHWVNEPGIKISHDARENLFLAGIREDLYKEFNLPEEKKVFAISLKNNIVSGDISPGFLKNIESLKAGFGTFSERNIIEENMYSPEGIKITIIKNRVYRFMRGNETGCWNQAYIIPIESASKAGIYKFSLVNDDQQTIPVLIDTQFGIELSGTSATFSTLKQQRRRLQEKSENWAHFTEIKNGNRPIRLSFKRCHESGFCMQGTKGFLKDKAPFLKAILNKFESFFQMKRKDKDLFEKEYEVLFSWKDYTSYLKRLL